MVDLIAKIMIVSVPVLVLIGAGIFFVKHREEWNQEIESLQKK